MSKVRKNILVTYDHMTRAFNIYLMLWPHHFQVDKRSLIIFPAVSILFNAGYWVHFVLARA